MMFGSARSVSVVLMTRITSETRHDPLARPEPRHFRAHDGLNLTYDDFGKTDGEPVVFLHGATDSRLTWERVTIPEVNESEVIFHPRDRLALISDGFLEAVGGAEAACELLTRNRDRASVDSVNELVYQVKKKLSEPEDMPEQDCTALFFDIDSRVLRLA